jgi:transcriptional regulator GlxA family with amidase domain
VLVVPDEGGLSPVMDLTVAEIERDEPGQQAVLDRLLDLLLLSTLREWFNRPEACAPAWYAALADPSVGRALRLMHEDPAHPWTVASLAAEANVSRATFARRFADLVGEPPMTYLTGWRLSLAADLLQRTTDTVDAVAHKVGYDSGFTLSVAFKRVYGTRPSDHRAGAGVAA